MVGGVLGGGILREANSQSQTCPAHSSAPSLQYLLRACLAPPSAYSERASSAARLPRARLLDPFSPAPPLPEPPPLWWLPQIPPLPEAAPSDPASPRAHRLWGRSPMPCLSLSPPLLRPLPQAPPLWARLLWAHSLRPCLSLSPPPPRLLLQTPPLPELSSYEVAPPQIPKSPPTSLWARLLWGDTPRKRPSLGPPPLRWLAQAPPLQRLAPPWTCLFRGGLCIAPPPWARLRLRSVSPQPLPTSPPPLRLRAFTAFTAWAWLHSPSHLRLLGADFAFYPLVSNKYKNNK